MEEIFKWAQEHFGVIGLIFVYIGLLAGVTTIFAIIGGILYLFCQLMIVWLGEVFGKIVGVLAAIGVVVWIAYKAE